MKHKHYAAMLTILFAFHSPTLKANTQVNIMKSVTTFSPAFTDVLNNAHMTARYELLSEGDKIGSLINERKSFVDDDGFEIIVTGAMEINIDSFWGEYHFISDEEIVINESGLSRYKGTFEEDQKKSKVMIEQQDGNVKIFGNSGSGDHFEHEFSHDEYDAVSEVAPMIFVRSGEKEIRLRVLDFDDFEIKEVTYRYLNVDSIEINDNTFECHRISFSTSVKRGEQCIIMDSTGGWVAYEKGKDADGDYTVNLTELTYNQ